MPFPETRPTLIARLTEGDDRSAWEQFLEDYWGPVVRFGARIGNLPFDQAEDIASETFLVIIRSKLLARWQSSPSGKLRSFICGVTRNLIANRQRVQSGRQQLISEIARAGGVPEVLPVSNTSEPAADDDDIFYRAWVGELLAHSMRDLLAELYAENRGDYFRALYGRTCEGLSAEEIGQALGIPPTAVENYLRTAKARLTRVLQRALRRHVERYSPAAELDSEFKREWAELADHLERFGGLEASLREEAAGLDRLPTRSGASKSFIALRDQLHIELKESGQH